MGLQLVLILIMLEGGFCSDFKAFEEIKLLKGLNPYYAGRWFLLNANICNVSVVFKLS